MAVVDVWAEANGQPCTLYRVNGDLWTFNAPSDCTDGVYSCSFWALDDAGNIGFKTATLWIYDGKLTDIEWIRDDLCLKYLNYRYGTLYKEPLYSMRAIPYNYSCCFSGRVNMINFLIGESRALEFEITHRKDEAFEIRDAKYELYKNNELVEEGDMIISGTVLSHIFSPEERGFYLFKILYTVGEETRAGQYHINVD